MFTYELSFKNDKFLYMICNKLKRTNKKSISNLLKSAYISIDDLGTSYYVDKKGRWDAKGIRIKFYVKRSNLSLLDNTTTRNLLLNICDSIIPAEVGYDIKEISFEENFKEDSLN
ncbi:MAG: hypothetical protein E6748_05680 [Clostridium perfringens]|nr:hypothetical protein [Clostridium perfringens]